MKHELNIVAMQKVFDKCIALGKAKSNDYSAVADGIGICGIEGIATRLVDKTLRVKSLTQPNVIQAVKDESIIDTLTDMINYATYGILILQGDWNKSSANVTPTWSNLEQKWLDHIIPINESSHKQIPKEPYQ